MLQASNLQRVFLHKENNAEIMLTDLGEGFSPEAVMTLYLPHDQTGQPEEPAKKQPCL